MNDELVVLQIMVSTRLESNSKLYNVYLAMLHANTTEERRRWVVQQKAVLYGKMEADRETLHNIEGLIDARKDG